MADNCREFPGTTGNYVKKVDPAGVTLDAAWSWGAWIKPDATTLRMIAKFGGDNDSSDTKVGPMLLSGTLSCRMAGVNAATGGTTISTAAWSRVGITKAGTGIGNVSTILNGSVETTESVGAPTNLAGGDIASVGRADSGVGLDPYDGEIAWMFWLQGVALSAAALDGYLNDPESLVDDYGPSGGVTANALKIYWPSQCDDGTTETDESGQSNDGTYTGTVTLNSGAGPSPSTPWDPCGSQLIMLPRRNVMMMGGR